MGLSEFVAHQNKTAEHLGTLLEMYKEQFTDVNEAFYRDCLPRYVAHMRVFVQAYDKIVDLKNKIEDLENHLKGGSDENDNEACC